MNAPVLLVSNDSALATRLSLALSVTMQRPQDAPALWRRDNSTLRAARAVVVAVRDGDDAAALVAAAWDAGYAGRIVVVSTQTPALTATAASAGKLHMLGLPLSLPDLLAAVDRPQVREAAGNDDVAEPLRNDDGDAEPEHSPRDVHAARDRGAASAARSSSTPDEVAHPAAAHDIETHVAPMHAGTAMVSSTAEAATPPTASRDTATSEAGPVSDASPARTDVIVLPETDPVPVQSRQSAPDVAAAPPEGDERRRLPLDRTSASADTAPDLPIFNGMRQTTVVDERTDDPLSHDRRASHYVRALLPLVDGLPSTSGAAGAVLSRAMDAVHAVAGAVLLPDGDDWRVAAGAGLRSLEWRLLLPRAHWVVQTVALQHRALIVDDSDTARGRLSPLPLSHLPHLALVPVLPVDGILVVSRADVFTDRDLPPLLDAQGAATDRVQDALRARELARALDPLRDLPE